MCPAHIDKTHSFRNKGIDYSHALMHCFSGCLREDITAAMSLNMIFLFSSNEGGQPSLRIPGISVREMKEAAEFERQILFIVSTTKL